MSNLRKHWTQPQLIVLGRGTPQERILVVCKNHLTHDFGPPDQPDCSKNSGNVCNGVTGT